MTPSVAVWVLTLAVAAGSALAVWHLRATDGASRPPLAAGIAHGAVGIAGLGFLLLAQRDPARAVAAGAGSFRMLATVLFAGAAVGGLILFFYRNGAVMAVHAGLAITAYVLLLAWYSLG